MDRSFHFYNAANILPVAFPVIAGSAFTQFDPHFEQVRGGVESWLMARWKARVDFLLSVIELLFLSLTVEALHGKTCQHSISGEGVVPREYFSISRKLDTLCYLTVQTAPCYMQSFGTIPACDRRTHWQTDRQTDRRTNGIAVASTALAMQALRRAVKMGVVLRQAWNKKSIYRISGISYYLNKC